MTVSSLLAKVNRLKREAIAAQPVDPLAELSTEQREVFKNWLGKLHARHADRPDALYANLISSGNVTPLDWLSGPVIERQHSETQALNMWNDFRDGTG